MSSDDQLSSITTSETPPYTTASLDVVVGSRQCNNYNDTELTLGLPGEFRKSKAKRRFSDIIDDLKLGQNNNDHQIDTPHSVITKDVPPVLREQVIGWPPVRSYRKNMKKITGDCKYVKVAVDGAPYLRKIDIELYVGYRQLLCAFEDMFSCFTIRNVSKEMKLMDRVNGMEYVPTYEDKDGDWMLVGDVPWEMFVESCKRIRLMKSSEAINGLDLLKKC